MRYLIEEKPSLEELKHFGVMGMKWGVRKEAGSETSVQKNRRLNKEFRKKANAERDAEIDAARQRYKTSARKNYLAAKAQYKIDKGTIGTAAAKQKLNAVRQKNQEDFEIGNLAKSGKETTLTILGIVGGMSILALSAAANSRR